MEELRTIAIHLPQFHPIYENNQWWGNGFTEWTNVTKAKPLFKGHHQPNLPTDLGFYDLRLEEARLAQELLAKQYGIYGFCYYHYWFKGKLLLQEPTERKLQNSKEDLPFMFFWANETWSRRWLGEEKEVLIKQEYSPEDDLQHIKYLIRFIKDKRYIRVSGKPVFIIYRPTDLPNPSATLDIFRNYVKSEIGEDLILVASNSHCRDVERLFSYGFDYVLDFKPQLSALEYAFDDRFLIKRLIKNYSSHKVFSAKYKVYTYQEALALMQSIEPKSFERILPCAFVSWDNTPRRNKNGIIIQDSNPELFRSELIRLRDKVNLAKDNLGLIIINAWNEWAEGNYLEPDIKNGTSFLEVIKEISS